MNKLIIKTALISVSGVALTALLVFSLWILISPQTMASSCEKTGNYTFAVTCADLRYKYTNDADDLSRCAEDSILSGKDKLIIKYGEMLIADDGYANLCTRKDKNLSESKYGKYTVNYNSYIGGNLSAAQWRAGEFDKAVQTAEKSGGFAVLVIEIIEHGPKEQAQKVLRALDGKDEELFQNLFQLLDKFINTGD